MRWAVRAPRSSRPSPIGEDTFVASPGGVRRQREAVTTVPEAVDASAVPAPVEVPTPDAPTVRRSWICSTSAIRVRTALDRRRHTEECRRDAHPHRTVSASSSWVVPGDRDIDMSASGRRLPPRSTWRRIRTSSHPRTGAATSARAVLGPNSPRRVVDEGRQRLRFRALPGGSARRRGHCMGHGRER